ncbi:DNA oxidative demethylase AlkB [Tatumella sp. TA1]|uniref:DNA oxidative demethylase AlkB n=1 Tax=Rosenbergiella collisarenosi TaxID=1544695 RepID=UPI0008F84C6E|nr:DNA oxidative demethylase AlkB [Rosenbergiella collisarenosi]QGX91813.1 DNA oxidative demethylase AlkB [Tatumella sp. TA1]
MFDFFQDEAPWQEPLAAGAVILRRFAQHDVDALYRELIRVAEQAPFVHRVTPGGFTMSVAMTGCGAAQWVSGREGYLSQSQHVALSPLLLHFAQSAATAAGYPHFIPDSCLINRYAPDSKMTLHQDKNERSLSHPIVSVSLGLPAVFLFGGLSRSDKTAKVLLEHGDVVVWGGASRLCFHGISPLKPGIHPLTGPYRFNLTFRKAL